MAKKKRKMTTSKVASAKTRKKVLIKKRRVFKKAEKKKLIKRKSKSVKRIIKKIVKRKKGSIKKSKQPKQNTHFPAESFFKAKIKVIGIGGGGASIVSEIGRSLRKATFVVADTDMRAFKKRAGIKNFLFGQELTHGLGTGVNPELGRMAAEQEKERITQFFEDQDIVIFVASLGGGLGSGATQVFAEAARDFNGITFGIFTLPFKFEGNNKYKIAYKALRELRKSLNVSITIPNERIFKIIDNNAAITDAFSMVNKTLIESLESLIDLIYSPGIINIDFADLRAILRGKGNLAFLNIAEESGKDRAENIAQKILHNPLYQNNNFTAEKILFNITGGANLGMFEVDKISRKISELNPKAKIIFGISKDSKYKNKIKTTLLMAGQGTASEPVAPKVVSPKVTIVAKKSLPITKKAQKNILEKKAIDTNQKKAIIKKHKKHGKRKPKKQVDEARVPFSNSFPIFNDTVMKNQSMPVPLKTKKAIRRTALDIKKAEEVEENKQSLQEKEWEIPAFLRRVKIK